MRPALKLLAALCMAQAVGGAQAQRLSVTAIPAGAALDVAGGGINNLGLVVGRLSDPVDGSSQAFVWSEAAGLQALGTLGGSVGWASAINDRGQIVGVSNRAGSSSLLGFIAQPGGGMQAVPSLSTVAGINSTGQVLGMGNPTTVFAYVYANGLTRLALTAPDDSLQVSGLSDRGGIAGAMRFTTGGPLEPFIHDAASGTSTRLFAGYAALSLWKAPVISPDGRSAVGALTLPGDPANSQAFLWQDGVLSLLPAGPRSSTNAVNDAGMVAGWSQQGSDLHAMLWLNGQALDLHALAGLGAGTSSATALNAWGQVVVNHCDWARCDSVSLVTLHPDWSRW